MKPSKEKVLKYLDILILVFLSFHVISSQLNIVISSIGLGGLIILIAIRFVIMKNRPDEHDSNLKYFFYALILFHLLTSSLSSDPKEAFLQNYRHIPLYAAFFAAIIYLRNLNQLRVILFFSFIFTASLSSYELIKYFTDFVNQNAYPIEEFRITYFGYPITNGEIKMLFILLIFPLIFCKEKFVLNRFWLIVLAIPIFLSLNFTNSRNAILGMFSGLLVMGILKHRIFLLSMIVILILFLLLAPLPIKERILSIADFNHPSIKSRFVMWETGLKIIKDHPIWGIGEVDLKKIYVLYKPIEFHAEGSHMHNNFLQIILNLGIPGFLVWLLLMVYIFFRQIKIYMLTKKHFLLNTLALASLISMVAFQISGLTEWNFSDFEFAAVLWFNLSIAFIVEKLFKQHSKPA